MTLSGRMLIVLAAVGLLSGSLLVGVSFLTTSRIALNKQRELESAIRVVVPGAEKSQKLFEEKDLSIYSGEAGDGANLGYAVYAAAGGFQDKITLLVGVNVSMSRINSLVILDQKETPGLGAKITNRLSFLVFWENKDCSRPLRLRKPPADTPDQLGPSEVNAITGATISSEAVLKSINVSLDKLRKLKAEGKLSS